MIKRGVALQPEKSNDNRSVQSPEGGPTSPGAENIEQLRNSGCPCQEPADQSCEKGRDIQEEKTQLLAREKESGVGWGIFS